MRTGRRRLTAGLAGWCALGLLAGCDLSGGTAAKSDAERVVAAPAQASGSSYDATDEDEQALRELMDARETAVREGDLRAFRATVDPRQPKLLAAQTVLFRNLQRLSVASFRYDVTTTYLVPAHVPGHDPVLHPQVLEQLQLVGTMTRPVSNKLDLTFVKRGDRWVVGAERSPGAKGAVEDPQERPWFGGPIAVRRDGKLTVLVDDESRDQLPGLVEVVQDGVRRDADILGVEVDDQVLVDATSNGQAQEFGAGVKEQVGATTFPIVSTDLDGDATDIAGTAIKVNPDHVAELMDESQLLWHELTHYLLFQHAGSSPVWLTEGVAAWVEYQPTELSGLVIPDDLYDRVQRPPHELPTVGVFYGKPDVHYLVGQAAVQWLVERAGTDALLDLMRTYDRLYQGSDVDEVTPRALRKVYDISERELVDGTWATLGTVHH
jgi:hypothetical protein